MSNFYRDDAFNRMNSWSRLCIIANELHTLNETMSRAYPKPLAKRSLRKRLRDRFKRAFRKRAFCAEDGCTQELFSDSTRTMRRCLHHWVSSDA